MLPSQCVAPSSTYQSFCEIEALFKVDFQHQCYFFSINMKVWSPKKVVSLADSPIRFPKSWVRIPNSSAGKKMASMLPTKDKLGFITTGSFD